MALIDGFTPHAATFDLAILAATISILLGGILLGVGMGLRVSRLRIFGQEELAQGIISAAMVGGIIAFSATLDVATLSLVPSSGLPACPISRLIAASPFGYYECQLEALSTSFSSMSSSLSQSSIITGFAATIVLSSGAVAVQPLFALEEASRSLSSESSAANSVASLAYLEFSLADMVRVSAVAIFLPIGLLLRAFFATRKLGAAIMAISVSCFMVYPLLFLHTFPISKSVSVSTQASGASESFNKKFEPLPFIPSNETSAAQETISGLSRADFGGSVQSLISSSASANSLAAADLFVFPLLALVASAVAAFELYAIFSVRVFLPYFGAV